MKLQSSALPHLKKSFQDFKKMHLSAGTEAAFISFIMLLYI